jgi:DNA-binding NarL/FixJ family response regulator
VRVLKPDVVLIDLLLARMSGYQAIPLLSSASPQSRIVVVSSQTGPTPVRQAISAGAHGYVPKRATDSELIDAIRRVAAGERYVDPDLGAQLVAADDVPASSRSPTASATSSTYSHLDTRTRRSARSCSSRCEPSTPTARTSCANCTSPRAPNVLFALSNGLIGAT